MLSAAIESYLDSLTEREFDAPFMALLRLQGFSDIHFLHGPFEFGKDFIAKRVEGGQEYQYAFQTKSGDINLKEWGGCRSQIDMLRTNCIAHSNFDKLLPRRARFVVTGRLIGGAPVAAQEYKEHLTSLGETEFETWDRESLVEFLALDPRCLSGSPLQMLQILGSTQDELNFWKLEVYSRNWVHSGSSDLNVRDIIEAAVIANHCRTQDRIDLACHVSLMLLRSTLATVHAQEPPPASAVLSITTAKAQFRHYARQIWNSCRDRFSDSDEIFQASPAGTGFAAYPVRCLTIVETIGALGLLEIEIGEDSSLPSDLADYLQKFFNANSGAAHPISDRWGISLVAPVLLLARFGMKGTIHELLRACTKWIADFHEMEGAGLAGPRAVPSEEVMYLLGAPFEGIPLRRRRESYLASIILDLASVLEAADLYDLARNEFLAADIILPVIETDDDQAQYCLHLGNVRLEPNMPYQEYWAPSSSWQHAPHHSRGTEARYAQRVSSTWTQFAVSCVVRDRYSVANWRALIAMGT